MDHFGKFQISMLNNKKIAVVLPAYNASKTLKATIDEIPHHIVDEIILVDDCSIDNTVEIAHKVKIQHIVSHAKNRGYGGNQKTCYEQALKVNADIIVMLHPDYQYTPKLIEAMTVMIANDLYDVVLGSRILSKGALEGGMPLYKYIANRILTFIQNILLNHKLSEYHTGYRAYTKQVLRKIDYSNNSDDFVFDNQLLSQIIFHNFRIGEISCPTKYFEEASSINFTRSVKYGLGCIATAVQYRVAKTTKLPTKIFKN